MVGREVKEEDLFQKLFRGELIQQTSSPASRKLVKAVQEVVTRCFGDSPESLSSESFRQSLQTARGQVSGPEFCELACASLPVLGFSSQDLQVDVVRLRAVSPGLETVEAAAPVFYAHRDTWYGNPKCQINVWLPLHRVDGDNSFRFFTDHFDRPIDNDSWDFVADSFKAEGGFGRVSEQPESVYPRALSLPQGSSWDVEMEEADLLLFSAAHLHQTQVNQTDRIRFSVDFRFFKTEHLTTGKGAPDPDNSSRGLCLESYRCV
jgi:hypothetical protein